MKTEADPDIIKSRINQSRSVYRESILSGLVGSDGAQSDDANESELRRLHEIDERLQAENIELDLMKQHVSEELRGAKAEELKRLSLEIEAELEQLDAGREKMVLDMDRKKSEIEILQRDLHQAEQTLGPHHRDFAAKRISQHAGVDSAAKERHLVGLSQSFATSMAHYSAERDSLLKQKQKYESMTERCTVGTPLRGASSGSPDSPASGQKGSTIDKMVAEAEALLRGSRYNNHDILRRLDKSRNMTPDTAAESVESLQASIAVRGDVPTTRDKMSANDLKKISTPEAYVPKRDILDRWLDSELKGNAAPLGEKKSLTASLRLNGEYKSAQSQWQNETIGSDQSELRPLLRSRSASARHQPLVSRGNSEYLQRNTNERAEEPSQFPSVGSDVRPTPPPPSYETFQYYRPVEVDQRHRRRPYGLQDNALQFRNQEMVPPTQENSNFGYFMQPSGYAPAPEPYASRSNEFASTIQPPFIRNSQQNYYESWKRFADIPSNVRGGPSHHRSGQGNAFSYGNILPGDHDSKRRDLLLQNAALDGAETSTRGDIQAMKSRMKALADELEAENKSLQQHVGAPEEVNPAFPGLGNMLRSDSVIENDAIVGESSSSTEAISEITQDKKRVDDILSKQVDINSFSGSRGRRSKVWESTGVLKEKTKVESEIMRMRLEMDMLRQKAALEELKEELEMQRNNRKVDKQHEDWLRERKYKLQAIRVQKAVSVEQKEYEDEMNLLGISCKDDYLLLQKSQPTVEQQPTVERPIGDIDGFEFCVDGITIPSSLELDGDSMRVVVGFIGAEDGARIGRVSCSEWQPCSKSIQRGKSFKRTQSELRKLNSDATVAETSIVNRVSVAAGVIGISGSPLCRRSTLKEFELMKLSYRRAKPFETKSTEIAELSSQLLIMIEVQVRRGLHGVPKGCGWCTIDPSICDSKDILSLRAPRFGNWRANMLNGVPDSSFLSAAKVIPNDENFETSALNSIWLLFRITKGGNKDINPVLTILEQDVNSTATWSVFMDYRNYSEVDTPPQLQKAESIQSISSVQSEQSVSTLPLSHSVDSTSAVDSFQPPLPSQPSLTGKPPPSTANSTRTNPHSTAPVSMKLSAGLDALSAIHEMKKLTSKADTIEKALGTDFFVAGTPPGPATQKYGKEDGIDVYIDGARFLPHNVTITRCVVKLLSSDMEPISLNKTNSVVSGFSAINSDVYSPTYRCKAECRASVFNCTAVLLLRLDTLDASSLQGCGVGYSALKLFCTKDRQAIVVPNDPDAYVNTGYFQLPIFSGRVPVGGTFQEDTLSGSMCRIPCASLLVRVVLAPKSSDGLAVLSCSDSPENTWEKLGIVVPAPDYGSGQYDGSLCTPSPDDLLCYSAKLGEKSSQQSGSSTVKGFLYRVLSTHATHTFPPAPEGPGIMDSDIQQWANSLLPKHDSVTSTLDCSFAVPYSFEAGLDVNVVSLYNVPDNGMFSSKTILYKAIYSMFPPAMFYHDPPHSEGVCFTVDSDFSSSARAPEYLDGYKRLFPTFIGEESYLIVDVRVVAVDKSSKEDGPIITVQPAGAKRSFWTLVPISKDIICGESSPFVCTGVYQVPLIEGPIPKFILDAEKPMRALLSALACPKAESGHLRLSGGSVLIMIRNPLLRDVLRSQYPELYQVKSSSLVDVEESIDPTIVAKNLELHLLDNFVAAYNDSSGETPVTIDKLKFDPGKFAGVKLLNSQLSKIEDHKKLKKNVNRAFVEAVGLTENNTF